MSVYATFPVLGDSDQSPADACASKSLVRHVFGALRFRLIACRRLCIEVARNKRLRHVPVPGDSDKSLGDAGASRSLVMSVYGTFSLPGDSVLCLPTPARRGQSL